MAVDDCGESCPTERGVSAYSMSCMLASFAKSLVSDVLLLGSFLLTLNLEVTVGSPTPFRGQQGI